MNRLSIGFAVVALMDGASALAQVPGRLNGPLPSPLVLADNWWRTDISAAPVDGSSAAFITFIGPTKGLRPDFGGELSPCEIYGFPYITLNATQSPVAKRAVLFNYADESDGVNYATGQGIPFYPIPDEAISQCKWIEGGDRGDQNVGGDRHMLIYDSDNQFLYEMGEMLWDGTRWMAAAGAFFDLKTNGRRPETWTSADAAGLAILPGLVRYDETFGAAEITHAFRVTVRATNGYVYPASHRAGTTAGALPMGARLRLKASKIITGPPEVQRIFRAMKTYGLIVADNGSDLFVSGVNDARWDNDVLNPAFLALKASDFEVIERGWQPTTGAVQIQSFTATPPLVAQGNCSTLSWSVAGAVTVTLNGASVGANAMSTVCPSQATTYTLLGTNGSGSTSRTVTVSVNDGTSSLGTPSVTSPASGQSIGVTGVGFSWTGVGGASGYDIRVLNGSTGALVSSGSLLGGGSTSTLISLLAGSYQFAVRACSGGFATSQCGKYGTVGFSVSPAGPSGAPTVTFPAQGANLTSSTQTLSWTAVTPNPAQSGLTYEVLLRDLTAGTTALQITVPSPTLSTIFTMKSSTQYELKVRACQAGCGPYSTAVTFAVTLPPIPVSAPTALSCSVSGGNSLTCNWNAVANADAYQVQVVQPPPAGPGGGALTAAARQVSATTVTLPVPAGAATVFVAACNGNGCGPSATTAISAAGPNPSQANIGTPMAGTVVAGPGVLFTWNRVPGDNGSNTSYRLFVQDLSRQATALDVFTKSNFYSAFFKAEGARYDALVVSNPGLPSQATGPSQGFNVSGASATSPTLVSPPHNGTVTSGNIQLGWSPVPGATLYEYFVAVLGQGSASARGVTPGLLAQVPLTGTVAGTVYSGIVRACPAAATCVSGSDTGWGPWSNAVGGPGVTNFTVVP